MLNVDKVKAIAKQKGIKIGYLCSELGFCHTYLNDIAKGKCKMIDEHIFKVARLLGTTYDYLTDLTDDPDPNYETNKTESPKEKLIHKVIERTMAMTGDQIDTLDKIFSMEDDDLDHILSVLKVMGEK